MTRRGQAYTVSITSFDEFGRFDEAGFRSHLRRQADAGVGVYVGGGGSGEGYTLNQAEVRRLLEISVEELHGKVPVRAMGVEPRSAAEMIAFLDIAADTGIDAAQVYPIDFGHAHQPSRRELVDYYEEVIEAARLPLLLSTHQSVGYIMPVEDLITLYERHPNLIGMNFSHHNLENMCALIDALADRFEFCVGGPEYALTCLSLGGHGFLCSEGNLAPRLCRSVVDAYLAGDMEALFSRYATLLRLSIAIYGNGGIRMTKAILARLGILEGDVRKPRLPPDPAATDEVIEKLGSLGIGELPLAATRTGASVSDAPIVACS